VRHATHRPFGRQRRLVAALTLVALGLSLSLFAAAVALALRPSQPTFEPDLQRFAVAGPAARPAAQLVAAQQLPRPLRIVIPAIRVNAPVIPLRLNRDRTLQVPKNFAQTGWFVGGPEPGEVGPAVIVGHVDSKAGAAVFYRIRALRRGDLIKVSLKGGSSVRFVVRGTRKVPKKRFPTKLVYGRTKLPTLRLVTCDGAFDRSTGHYVDNFIVFADLAR
jgi:sortase (surface protein transpeptidase)